MTLHFQSLSSSSAGNCLVLWTDKTRVIIDCGLASMRRTREVLENNLQDPRNVDAVIISHMHGDHINHHSLRVIEEYGLTVWVSGRCLGQLKGKHFNGHKFHSIDLKTFSDRAMTVGDLSIQPFEVPHQPIYPNCGFAVKYKAGGHWKHAVIVTDFHNGRNALAHLIDADFIFVESNHDLGLLAKYSNPNSRFHMSNPKTAELLYTAYMQSCKKPKTVMLGHLSAQRNTEPYALKEVHKIFQTNETDMGFELCAAPLLDVSRIIEV
jgi:phosphoribosyl 1,2-cyclic phosphodiesterase